MRILVCGARGFVGAEIIRQLHGAGHEIIAADVRGDPGRLAAIAGDLEWRIGDCSDAEFMQRAVGSKGVDAIYYGPFYRAPAGTPKIQTTELQIMGAGALGAFNLARTLGIKRIAFPSSTAVHGPQRPDEASVDETSSVRPNGVYGATKLLVEEWAKVVNADLGRNAAVCVRLPSIYGPGADIGSRRANVFAVQAARGQQGVVELTAETPICLTHVADTAAMLVKVLTAEKVDHTVYELGGITATFAEIAASVRRHVPDADLQYGPGTLSPLPSVVDCGRARAEFGITHRSLDEGMTSIIEYEWARRRASAG